MKFTLPKILNKSRPSSAQFSNNTLPFVNEEKRILMNVNDSFETSLSRAVISSKELLMLLERNKLNSKYPLKPRFLKLEKDYSEEINTRLLKVARLIDKIPKPKVKKKKKILLPKIPKYPHHQYLFTDSQITESNSLFNDLEENLENEIKKIFASQDGDDKRTQNDSKFRKLHTIYKYINDTQTSMKFHYFICDFQQRSLNDIILPNNEYKFIKIKNESIFIVSNFSKVLKLIIKYFYLSQNFEISYSKESLKRMKEYLIMIKKKYVTYKTQLTELVKNYSVITNGLIMDKEVYNNYIYKLCDMANETSKEEGKFFELCDYFISKI